MIKIIDSLTISFCSWLFPDLSATLPYNYTVFRNRHLIGYSSSSSIFFIVHETIECWKQHFLPAKIQDAFLQTSKLESDVKSENPKQYSHHGGMNNLCIHQNLRLLNVHILLINSYGPTSSCKYVHMTIKVKKTVQLHLSVLLCCIGAKLKMTANQVVYPFSCTYNVKTEWSCRAGKQRIVPCCKIIINDLILIPQSTRNQPLGTWRYNKFQPKTLIYWTQVWVYFLIML